MIHDSSLNQIGRNMIIIVLIILLSYIFTMDSVKNINKQLLFILLVFVAIIIYKIINYNAFVKYTNDKINELKKMETFNVQTNNLPLAQNIKNQMDEIYLQYSNMPEIATTQTATNYNNKNIPVY